MRLAQIVPSLEERHGGPSRSVRHLAAALAQLGHDVDLLATRPEGVRSPEQDGRLRILQFRRDQPQFLCPSAGLRDHLRRQAYDCVHHHSLWLRPLHYAARTAGAASVPLIISPRGMMSDWAWAHHRWRKRLAAAWVHPGAFARASGWHATSAGEVDEIRRRGFSQPVCLAPNGVAAPSAEEVARARDFWSAHCPASGQRPIALFYSRLHRKKRVRELIELWAGIAPPDWLLLVVGIPEEFTVDELTALSRDRGAADRVAVFDGIGRPPPYAIASLFLLPTHSENFGLVVAEAMAWGVPALVTDTTPWAGLAQADVGWCVPWTDYPAKLRATLAENRELLSRRGARARDWVLARYSWAQSARLLEDFYRQSAACPT